MIVLVETTVPMYLIGGPHVNKGRAETALREAVQRGDRLVTDAEVLQEICHRSTTIRRREAITRRSARSIRKSTSRTCSRPGLQIEVRHDGSGAARAALTPPFPPTSNDAMPMGTTCRTTARGPAWRSWQRGCARSMAPASSSSFSSAPSREVMATPESDLDVLAVLRGPLDRAAERRRLDEPLWELMLAVGRVVSVIPVEQHDLDDESPLMLNARREGVRVR